MLRLILNEGRESYYHLLELACGDHRGITVMQESDDQFEEREDLDALLVTSRAAQEIYGASLTLPPRWEGTPRPIGDSQVFGRPDSPNKRRGAAWIVTQPLFPAHAEISPEGTFRIVPDDLERTIADEVYQTFLKALRAVVTWNATVEERIGNLGCEMSRFYDPGQRRVDEVLRDFGAITRAYEDATV